MIKLAVIGDPIEHSLSPIVHLTALEAIGVDCDYERVCVKKGGLSNFLTYAAENGINGFNLTMPHKVDILPFLSEIDTEAKRFESVNTVKVVGNKLCGYNTDSDGYCESLKSTGRSFSGSRTVIIGAGGVVRTLALKAAYEGASSIFILNRTAEKAHETANAVKSKTSADISGGILTQAELTRLCGECDILINATPLGMSGVKSNFTDFSFLKALPKTALVSDLIYNPDRTELLTQASALGLDTLNGLGMLIYQALLADKIYTGIDFDMKKVFEITSDKVKKSIQK